MQTSGLGQALKRALGAGNPTCCILIYQAAIAKEQEQLAEAVLAGGWREGSVFAFDFSGSAKLSPGIRPVPEESGNRRLLRRLAFFSEPQDLPHRVAPVILLGLWADRKAENAVFAYPGISAERLSAARQMVEQGCEAVVLRRDDGPPSVLALEHNPRNERLLAHWVDLLERFSSSSKRDEQFDVSLPGRMAEYLCDRIGSIRESTHPVAIEKDSTRITPFIRNAVRNILPMFPELLDDPFGNATHCLNAPSPNIAQDPGNLITCLVHFVWSTRSDLQAAFDLSTYDGRKGFVDWLFSRGPIELDLGDEFLSPIRAERENPSSAREPQEEPAIAAKSEPVTNPGAGVNLIGYPRAEMGMGELMRQCAAGFSTTNVPFCLVDFNFGLIASQHDERYEELLRSDNPYATNLFHINADQMRVAREQLGAEFFRNHYNIGYWAWELSSFPDEWQDAIDLVDEIWAPSKFVQQAVSKKTAKPIIWMPLAVEFPEPSAGNGREKFGLPEDAFLFLFTFDFSSFAARKNFRGCIEAFQKAFFESNDAALVIKTIRHPHHEREFWDLLRAIGDDKRIFVIDRVLRRPELYELTAACDAFVSLHRSEGFGLGIAEAMYLGKPVIATNYSGNVDFTTSDNSCLVNYRLIPVEPGEYLFPEGQVWADPDLDQAAAYMRSLVDDRDYAKRLGAAAAEFMRRQHSANAVGARYARRLKQIASARALLTRAE